MAESSIFWTTNGTGDGGANYTESQLVAWLRRTFIRDVTTQGVLAGYANAFAATVTGVGDTTPVEIETGAAMVYGYPYESDSMVQVEVPTPSVSTRIDRIVLRVDWTAQTVRIARVAGAEGGSAPALTQIAGTTWEISLAQLSVTTGGVITVTDQRSYCHFNTTILGNQAVFTGQNQASSMRAGIATVVLSAAASGTGIITLLPAFDNACDYVSLTPVSLGDSYTVGLSAAPTNEFITYDWEDTNGTTHTVFSVHYIAIGH